MVRRYFGEEPEEEHQFNFEDGIYDDDEDEGNEEANVAYISTDDFVEMMHMDLAQTELNQHLLGKAIDIAQQSFFWRFRSTVSKMQTIKRIYRELLEMTEKDDEGEE